MFSTNAESNLFKEFSDFSIGRFDDGFPHYNGLDLLDESTAKDYYKKVSEYFEQFSLEMETNLVFLAESKAKSIKYLQKVEMKLEDVRDRLHKYHYEILDDDFEEDGWRPKLWNRSQYYLDKIINYSRAEFNTIKTLDKSLGNKKTTSRASVLLWVKESILLGRLYDVLIESGIIGKGTFSDYESHFINKPNIEFILKPIKWQREKYLLIYLFDELYSKGFLDKTYSSNCDVLLSKHFTHKDKIITTRQLASARHSFKKTNASVFLEKNKSFTIIYGCLNRLFAESLKKPKG